MKLKISKLSSIIGALAISSILTACSEIKPNEIAIEDDYSESKISEDQKDFLSLYAIYYYGYKDNKLAVFRNESSILQDDNLREAVADSKIGIKLFGGGRYVVERFDNKNLDWLHDVKPYVNTLLSFNDENYERHNMAPYFIQNENIIYTNCLNREFDIDKKSNICIKTGLFINDKLIDSDEIDIVIEYVDKDNIFYSTYKDYADKKFSYNLKNGEIISLDSIDPSCRVIGFKNKELITKCTEENNLRLIEGEKELFNIETETYFQGLDSKYINGHLYFINRIFLSQPSSIAKLSLIKDNLKISEVHGTTLSRLEPQDGQKENCVLDKFELWNFCIYSDNIISRDIQSNGVHDFYLNEEKIDFSPFSKLGEIESSIIIFDEKDAPIKILSVVFDGKEENLYIADYLGKSGIGKPNLIIKNISALIGITSNYSN